MNQTKQVHANEVDMSVGEISLHIPKASCRKIETHYCKREGEHISIGKPIDSQDRLPSTLAQKTNTCHNQTNRNRSDNKVDHSQIPTGDKVLWKNQDTQQSTDCPEKHVSDSSYPRLWSTTKRFSYDAKSTLKQNL